MAKIDKKLDNFIDEKIKSQRLEEIMSERFGRYSKYIIQDRALPDARDGLKPVQRRILYAMDQMGLAHNKSYKKSARIAGEVMGKYHPHGDSSIYDAMVRLSQDFKMRVPLIDMHGNNGSIDGDSAAAMRYTEARLSKEAEYLLADIDKRTVNFVPNFDDEEIEPTVLPAKFPNLLVNGAMGISAGYATKIPPHNLREIITATLALIDNPKLTVDEIANIIKGPDFPTGGIVQGKEGILQALATGVGKVIIRATSQIEEISKSQDRIVITQIPYEVVKSDLIRDIDNLRISNNVEDILEVRDETDQEGLRIAIDLKKGANTEVILNYLFKNTNLQVSYNYNMVSIMNSRPVLSGVIPLLLFYIEHQKEVITNRSNFELERAMKRQHIVAGLIKMVSIVDEVISIIRGSKNKADSKQNLMDKFDFSDLQAEAIVMLQLYRLSTTDIQALISENEQLSSQIDNLNEILSNEKVLLKLIKKELANTLEVLGTDRKSVIEEEIASIKIDETQLISDERVVVAVTKDGYIKRSSVRSFSASKEVGLKENDAILFESEVSTLDTLIIFLSKGNYAYLPIHKIDEQKWRDLGIYLNNLVTINRDEKIVYATVVNTFNTAAQILLASKLGMMKQIKLSDLEVSRYNKAIRVMKLDNDDELVAVDFNTKEYIVALSKNGYGLRFKSQELPLYGLSAGGVKGMALNQGDNLASAFFATGADEIYILTSRAHVIKDVVAEIPLYARYRKGIMIIDKQKTNPHYIRSACRFTKAQAKDDCLCRLVTTKTYKILAASELKANGNKFGKKMFADNEGEGLFLAISPSLNEKEETVVPPKASEVVKEKPTKLVEEAIIKGNTQIRLSRLDLFDDED